MTHKIIQTNFVLTDSNIKTVEEMYKARFICETSTKLKNGDWANQPVALFYTETPHPDGSNWFILYYRTDLTTNEEKIFIADGKPATEEPLQGYFAANGDIVYSVYRHHMHVSPDKSIAIDGGRDYNKIVAYQNYIPIPVTLDITPTGLKVRELENLKEQNCQKN